MKESLLKINTDTLVVEGVTFSSAYWSLGVILFEMITSKPLFQYQHGDGDSVYFHAALYSKPRLELVEDLPARELVGVLLNKDPYARLNSLDEMKSLCAFKNINWPMIQNRRMKHPTLPLQRVTRPNVPLKTDFWLEEFDCIAPLKVRDAQCNVKIGDQEVLKTLRDASTQARIQVNKRAPKQPGNPVETLVAIELTNYENLVENNPPAAEAIVVAIPPVAVVIIPLVEAVENDILVDVLCSH